MFKYSTCLLSSVASELRWHVMFTSSPMSDAGHNKHLVTAADTQNQLNGRLPSSPFFLSHLFHRSVQYTKGEWTSCSPSVTGEKYDAPFSHVLFVLRFGSENARCRLETGHLFLSQRILPDCEVCGFSWAGRWLGSPWLLVWWSFWWRQWACSWGCSWARGRKTPLPPWTTSTQRLPWLLMLGSVQKSGGEKTDTLRLRLSKRDKQCSVRVCVCVWRLPPSVFLSFQGHFEEERFSRGRVNRCLAMRRPFERSQHGHRRRALLRHLWRVHGWVTTSQQMITEQKHHLKICPHFLLNREGGDHRCEGDGAHERHWGHVWQQHRAFSYR